MKAKQTHSEDGGANGSEAVNTEFGRPKIHPWPLESLPERSYWIREITPRATSDAIRQRDWCTPEDCCVGIRDLPARSPNTDLVQFAIISHYPHILHPSELDWMNVSATIYRYGLSRFTPVLQPTPFAGSLHVTGIGSM